MINNTPEIKLGLSLIHISEPTRHSLISYAVFCLKAKQHRYYHLTARRLSLIHI